MQTPPATPPYDALADRLRSALMLFGVLPALVVAVVVLFLLGPLVALVALVVIAGGWAALVAGRVRGSVDRALQLAGARPERDGEFPRWENVLDGLGATSGVDPELWVVDRAGANAMAVADRDRVALVATTELVGSLGPVELEAVAANLLGRVKDGSARYGTVATTLVGPFLGKVDAAGKVLAEGLGDQRAVHSDLAAVGLTRYPPGLARALTHLEELGTEVPGVDPSTAHLWVAPVVADGAGVAPEVAATALQPLGMRIEVLGQV
ncbi:MAG: hypothetical protein ACOYOP_10085 [Microthrixaceae bacterium]